MLVLLHGRNRPALSMLPLAEELALNHETLITPEAEGGSWYPYSTLAPRAMNEPALSQSLEQLEALLQEVLQKHPPEQVILSGFAQGACLALEHAMRHPRPYRAVLSFHGVLMDETPALPHKDTQYFFCSSENDPLIPAWKVRASHEKLCLLGAKSSLRLYAGMHEKIPPEELIHIREALGVD